MTTRNDGADTTPDYAGADVTLQHITDAHLGARRHGYKNPDTGESTADESVLSCWESAIHTGIENNVDAIVISGDLFDTSRPAAEMIARAMHPLTEALNQGIKVIAENGNHGRHGLAAAHRGPVDLLRSLGVTVYDSVGLHTLETKSGPLHVLGVPWPERARLLYEAGADQVAPDQVDALIGAYVTELIEDAMDAADISAGERLIVSSHITIGEANIARGSETVVNPRGVFEEVQIPLESLTGTGADYVALGHIHHHQHVGPRASYAGSLDRLTFGEAEDPKGTLLVGLTDDGPARRFIDTPARKMLNLRLENDPEPDLSEAEPGTLVKVHLAPGERAVPPHVRKAISAAGAIYVKPKIQPLPKSTTTGHKIKGGLAISDAVTDWAQTEKISPEDTAKILDRINTYL